MSEGLLSLQWNNHKFTLHQMLSSIRKKKSYTDTTLACDGLLYPVHKIVLSMCSKYFEEIFVQTQGQHPVIILKDIKRHELECLLNYMYIGEVNVPQEKLAGLIKAAECLQIKGLAVPDEEPLPSNKSNKGAGGEKRGREESQTSEAKKRRQDVCTERNIRNSHSLSPEQVTKATSAGTTESIEVNESSTAQSPKSKISFRNQQKRSESFATNEKSEAASKIQEDSSNQDLSSLKEEAEEEDPEETYIESGSGGTVIKEEPVYLSDSNSNDEHQQHVLLSAGTGVHEGSQMHFMEQLLANEAAAESLADEGNCVREGSSSDAQLCSTVGHYFSRLDSSQAPSSRQRHGHRPHGGRNYEHQLNLEDDFTPSSTTFISLSQSEFANSSYHKQPHNEFSKQFLMREAGTSASRVDLSAIFPSVGGSPSVVARPGGPRAAGPTTYYGPFLPFEALDLPSLLTDEKLYQCPGCPRRFGFKSEFKIHYMIHSGEKPFRCYLCPYGTNQKSHLKRHVEQRHLAKDTASLTQ